MTEVEKRRLELLRQMRENYSQKDIPAVHPRYRNAYKKLYGNDESQHANSFKFRVFLAALILVIFAAASKNNVNEVEYVMNEIQQDFDGFVDLIKLD